jgi:type III pantothenate kinase
MYIIGDIGNTEVKLCLFDKNGKLIKKTFLKSNLITKKFLLKKLFFLRSKSHLIKTSVFSSVVPKIYKIIKSFLINAIKVRSIELKEINLNKIINIKVNKKQIGSDRLANAISVCDNKNNFIIVDFGTATTFDVVIKNNYLGGIIAPGVGLSLNTLISNASLIPNLNLKSINNVLGKSTKNAVRSGFYWGYIGLIDKIINKILEQTKKKYKIVFTGGLSHLFNKCITHKVIIDSDITVNGLLKTIQIIKT